MKEPKYKRVNSEELVNWKCDRCGWVNKEERSKHTTSCNEPMPKSGWACTNKHCQGQRKFVEQVKSEDATFCPHCGYDIRMANPAKAAGTGNCSHIYWPENLCEVCQKARGNKALAAVARKVNSNDAPAAGGGEDIISEMMNSTHAKETNWIQHTLSLFQPLGSCKREPSLKLFSFCAKCRIKENDSHNNAMQQAVEKALIDRDIMHYETLKELKELTDKEKKEAVEKASSESKQIIIDLERKNKELLAAVEGINLGINNLEKQAVEKATEEQKRIIQSFQHMTGCIEPTSREYYTNKAVDKAMGELKEEINKRIEYNNTHPDVFGQLEETQQLEGVVKFIDARYGKK